MKLEISDQRMTLYGEDFDFSTEAKFTELLDSEGYSVERKAVPEVAYVAQKGSDAGDDNSTGAGPGGPGGPQGGELEG